jgi:uncharacterized delta-60 repeat protein
MKGTRLVWFAIVTLVISLNLVSCSSSGGGTSSTTTTILTTTTTILTTTTTTTISTTTTLQVGTDPSFGTGGIVTTAIGTDDEAFALATQSDGKLVAAGYSFNGTLSQNVWAVVRYNTNGSLDTTFNTTGIVTTQIGTTDDEALALAIQSDGKLVTAGQSYNDTLNQYVFALVRYNTDGTPDMTFGTAGIVTTQIGTFDDISFALAIQSDGKLVAAGISNNGSQEVMALARYKTDGTLDKTFNTTGIVTTQIGTFDDEACALAIQSDGKLVTAGFTYDSITLNQNVWAVVRYNTDGTLDTTFGTAGVVTTPVGNDDDAEALAIQSDGKLVTAGNTGNGTQLVFALVRYTTNGTPDTTFGSEGIVTTTIGTVDDEAAGLAIDSNGKPVAAGFSNYGTLTVPQYEFALIRYTTTGALDTTFHTTGIVTTRIGTIDDEAFALRIQSDGKLVAAGYSDNGTQNSFALVRYLP